MPRRREDPTQLELEALSDSWPPADRFPYNFRGETVGQFVRADLDDSHRPLLITGYTSLEWIIDYLADHSGRASRAESVRILIGFEPHSRVARSASGQGYRSLPREVADYWLERGISLRQAPKILLALQALESRRIQVRQAGRQRIHAKIYVGDDAVTIGSSNFSRSGMIQQLEGNVRFTKDDSQRYAEAVRLAEAIWGLGENFKPRLRELLERLLSVVSWQEALGRAVGEILEGDWARQLMESLHESERPTLWPSQDAGIAEALWVMKHSGSVLVADATGSGKTRLGAGLIRALVDQNWRTGRARRDLPVMICPPAVTRTWNEEGIGWGQALKVYSHGVLSHRDARQATEVVHAVSRAQILAIDEAHNFLNLGSRRSRALLGTAADHVVLFTATPINRSAEDLISVIDLLGADNFGEDVLQVVGQIARRRRATGATLSLSEVDLIRRALSEFVVRRTKSELNQLVDRSPREYRDVLGRRCRYPIHSPHFYPTRETESDQDIARQIQALGGQLKGLINLRAPLELADFLRRQGVSEDAVLKGRLRSAPALARWQINSTLRSSRAALWEHLFGTKVAAERFRLEERFKASETGDVISKLADLAGNPPEVLLDVPVPKWLSDAKAHAIACAEERAIYRAIGELCGKLSERRLDARARHLFKLWQRRGKVIAFDRSLISLFLVRRKLFEYGLDDDTVIVATGEKSSKERLASRFRLGAEDGQVIGLCSDALSEAVNLQEASALVHLDLPTVIRTLEQRVGRIDRMDSPHERIDVHWPQNTEAFSLRSDERLLERHRMVEQLLGSNVPWPEQDSTSGDASTRGADSTAVTTETLVRSLEEEAATVHWDGLSDAFSEVRGLVEGPDPLISSQVYEALSASRAKVVSAISVVESDEAWAFLAVAGLDDRAPRWVLVERDTVMGDLHRIPAELRRHLTDQSRDHAFNEEAAQVMGQCLDRLRGHERALLPRRKARALTEMEAVLGAYRKTAKRSKRASRQRLVEDLLTTLSTERSEEAVDLGRIADWWLDLIRPTWQAYMASPGRRGVARIKRIRDTLKTQEIPDTELATAFEHVVSVPSLDRRVIAAVIGVPPRTGSPTPPTTVEPAASAHPSGRPR